MAEAAAAGMGDGERGPIKLGELSFRDEDTPPWFGESALHGALGGEKHAHVSRVATAAALEPTSVLSIHHKGFDKLLENFPSFGAMLLQNAAGYEKLNKLQGHTKKDARENARRNLRRSLFASRLAGDAAARGSTTFSMCTRDYLTNLPRRATDIM